MRRTAYIITALGVLALLASTATASADSWHTLDQWELEAQGPAPVWQSLDEWALALLSDPPSWRSLDQWALQAAPFTLVWQALDHWNLTVAGYVWVWHTLNTLAGGVIAQIAEIIPSADISGIQLALGLGGLLGAVFVAPVTVAMRRRDMVGTLTAVELIFFIGGGCAFLAWVCFFVM